VVCGHLKIISSSAVLLECPSQSSANRPQNGLETLPEELADQKMKGHLLKMLSTPYRAFNHQSDVGSRQRLELLIENLGELDPDISVFEIKAGVVKAIKWDRDLGFISVFSLLPAAQPISERHDFA
jgi:hypothetical protein